MANKLLKKYIIIFIILGIGIYLNSCGQATVTPASNSTASGDAVAPGNVTISINNGSSSTESVSVKLQLSSKDNTGITGYYASEESATPNVKASGWVAVTSTAEYISTNESFTLSGSVGTKEVFVWFKDAAENMSSPVSSKIILSIPASTSPAVLSITLDNGSALNNNATNITTSNRTPITVKFNKSMKASTISSNIYVLGVSGMVSIDATSTVATWTANSNLSYGTQYTFTVSNGVTDNLGKAISGSSEKIFTTLKILSIASTGSARHTLFIKSDGTVWSTGYNDHGELGIGTTTNQLSPVCITSFSTASAIATGDEHSLVLSNGELWTFGKNTYGQLGMGSTQDAYVPVRADISNVAAIAAGTNHSLALKTDGTVWAWGRNESGQLGDGTNIDRSTPVQVSGLTGVIAVACGGEHSLALKSDGTVWAWGQNFHGQLGDGTTTYRNTPVQVSGITGVISISGGYFNFSLAVKSDGTVWAWGWNADGQLGDGTNTTRLTPVQIPGINNAVAVAAGMSFSIILKSDGTVWATGANASGTLGDGTQTKQTSPVQSIGVSQATAITAGRSFSVALCSAGKILYGWGYTGEGQFGYGISTQLNTPAQIPVF